MRQLIKGGVYELTISSILHHFFILEEKDKEEEEEDERKDTAPWNHRR